MPAIFAGIPDLRAEGAGPMLRWISVLHATRYDVLVQATDDPEDRWFTSVAYSSEVVFGSRSTGRSCRDRAPRAGATYRWNVRLR